LRAVVLAALNQIELQEEEVRVVYELHTVHLVAVLVLSQHLRLFHQQRIQ
jgi:hypothetical protein